MKYFLIFLLLIPVVLSDDQFLISKGDDQFNIIPFGDDQLNIIWSKSICNNTICEQDESCSICSEDCGKCTILYSGLIYNLTLLCDKSYWFLKENEVYTEDQFNYFKDSLISFLGYDIDKDSLKEFLNKFKENCPNYLFPVKLKEKNYIWILFIVLFIVLIIILFLLLQNKRYVLFLLWLKKYRKKMFCPADTPYKSRF